MYTYVGGLINYLCTNYEMYICYVHIYICMTCLDIGDEKYVDDVEDHDLLSFEEMTCPVAMRSTFRALQQELSSARPTPLVDEEFGA